jgi:diguanylate cyclase (GGDEF)-like protein
MQKEVSETIERLRGYGLSEEQLRNEARIRVEEIEVSYIDKRFEAPNQNYLRLETNRKIDQVINDNPNETKINGIGMLSFDLNGLKAVNDLNGHLAGDTYLKRAAEIFKNGKTTQKIKARNIEVFFAAGGGDEFSILLSGEENLSDETNGKSLIEQLKAEYEEEIAAIDCSDLIDFSKKDTASKFKEIEIPKDFKFHASVSGGFSTLRESLIDYFDNPGEDENGRTYQTTLFALMGRMIDTSDKREREKKQAFKEKIAGGDEKEKFLGLLLKRNSETMEIEQKNQELKEKISALEKKLKKPKSKKSSRK